MRGEVEQGGRGRVVEQSAAAKLGDDEEQGTLKGAGWHFIQVHMCSGDIGAARQSYG